MMAVEAIKGPSCCLIVLASITIGNILFSIPALMCACQFGCDNAGVHMPHQMLHSKARECQSTAKCTMICALISIIPAIGLGVLSLFSWLCLACGFGAALVGTALAINIPAACIA